jgi:UDP-N-acetylmuramoyl-tripeptide--D-alanyl-D-alanine ligase
MLPMAGRHNARNAAAAAAAAFAADARLADIVHGLERSAGVAGRMQIATARCGARVIDDSYNANPESARAAIAFLAEQKEPGWLVLGDMAELGSNAPHLHAEIGKRARELGIQRLFATGQLARAAVAAFGEGAEWFEDADSLGAALLEQLHDDLNVLVKGSRTMRLERVVDALGCSIEREEAVK